MFHFKRVHSCVWTAVVFDEAGDVAVLLSVDAHVGEDEGLFLAVLLQLETGNTHTVNGVCFASADVLAAVFSNEPAFRDGLGGADVIMVVGE
jgi:hypothetical protein